MQVHLMRRSPAYTTPRLAHAVPVLPVRPRPQPGCSLVARGSQRTAREDSLQTLRVPASQSCPLRPHELRPTLAGCCFSGKQNSLAQTTPSTGHFHLLSACQSASNAACLTGRWLAARRNLRARQPSCLLARGLGWRQFVSASHSQSIPPPFLQAPRERLPCQAKYVRPRGRRLQDPSEPARQPVAAQGLGPAGAESQRAVS
ncbi:hypothetical protein B0J12DRAFT_677576 [Macrophomina phaseolina]|uniref:Uncharacterized protein n=1 Tax=Macrophomina phaseolina TaxID=35725 RepID=A0ABQ8FZJ5_9PEZI|nr:hypothetical protein B0J12DRAFT_677576 [Macrophomina phaseolina]